VKTERYSRTMRLEAWSKGRERSLIRIISPKKDMGISTLKVEQNIWNYLPRINRVTKIPPSMMMGSWMGSHFTNDDLVKESSFEKDYTSSITFQGEREGKKIYEITSLPRPDAPVVWGKVVTLVEQETLLPLKTFYHDEEGALARVMAFDMRRRFGDRLLPARMELRPADKPGEYTTVIYEEMEFDVELSDEMFSLQNLRRG
ncbi:MAG: outer membrane lipoprotein-sorting protein, partial [Deltaproteobacteria bacterium]|nr:outer membrane lipoprotein-sorting protein [Deltaproteobacteria bacterium]